MNMYWVYESAQHEIATDWIKAYQKYIAETPPASHIQAGQFEPETATESEVRTPGLVNISSRAHGIMGKRSRENS
jgi:hypothetical protein